MRALKYSGMWSVIALRSASPRWTTDGARDARLISRTKWWMPVPVDMLVKRPLFSRNALVTGFAPSPTELQRVQPIVTSSCPCARAWTAEAARKSLADA